MVSKECTKCNISKPLSEFHKGQNYKGGYRTKCKSCRKLYAQDNKTHIKEYKSKNYLNNKEHINARNKQYGLDNKDRLAKAAKLYQINNRGICNARKAAYKASKAKATPKWLTDFDLTYIKSIYMQGSFLEMHVDHIVPLRGKNVCGFHVPWNLQLLSPEDNLKKSNKF